MGLSFVKPPQELVLSNRPWRQLALNANRLVLHEQLLTAVWGPEYRDDIDYLRAYVRYLRRKIEPDPAHPTFVLTKPGVGYMLVCPEDPSE